MVGQESEQRLRVVVFREGDQWVAQCLEHDIGAQAEDLDTLQQRLASAVMLELQESLKRSAVPFAGIEPAPARFHELWDRQTGTYHPARAPTHDVSLDIAMYA